MEEEEEKEEEQEQEHTEKKCLLCTVKLYSKKNLTVNYCTNCTVIYCHTVNILLYSKYLLSDSKYLLSDSK